MELSEKLPQSNVCEALFSLLVIRRELQKERFAKESDPLCQGRVKELGELLELFEEK